jgi:hypothetical protein
MDDESGEVEVEGSEDELSAAVLEFVRAWPSKYPSPARIAQAIGRSPAEVIEALARLRTSGEYPAVEQVAPSAPLGPSLDTWDRAN